MHDSVDTSASAASSAGSSSPPGSSGDSSPETLRVDFYVLEEASSMGRLKLACRLAEKAYLAAQTALVWHTDPKELKDFDELLWTFMDGSFVPHDMLGSSGASLGGAPPDSPVLLSAGLAPPRDVDIIINLAPEVPSCLARTRRVAEIIDGDDARRRAGRARFKAYRDLGVQPASHNIRSE
jgi:DNA polymerase-3 subunit chi